MSDGIPSLGPALTGTLVCSDLDFLVKAYDRFLDMKIIEEGSLSPETVRQWGAPGLEGHRYAVLASKSSVPWLRVVEDKDAVPAKPFLQQGWLSLEVLVADVDQLALELANSPFEIYRPPADLDVSDAIRAMQVIGPAGEVLYLTQVNAEVPPFEIPQARCRIDQLFIPVMCCLDREQALAFYRQFEGGKDYLFDTRITSVNSAYGYELERKHPVATVQLAAKTMVEIDQIDAAAARPCAEGRLPAGIAMISYEIDNLERTGLPWFQAPRALAEQPYGGRRTVSLIANGGERVELIERG